MHRHRGDTHHHPATTAVLNQEQFLTSGGYLTMFGDILVVIAESRGYYWHLMGGG